MRTGISDIEREYMTPAQIAKDAGQDITTVCNWLNYHRYMIKETILGKPAVKKTNYEQFKLEHPELIKSQGVAQ